MTRNVLIVCGFLVVAGAAAGGYFMLRPPEPAWTTASPRALAEFEEGFDDLSKYYWADAIDHFRAALELDPDFVMAKLHLAEARGHLGEKENDELWAELAAADRGPLNPQERFLLDYRLALRDDEAGPEAAEALLDDFLARHPESFFGRRARCDIAWRRENLQHAEECYRRLLELHPNWVQAQNRLGYIAMSRGRFTEAEEHFLTYRYIAPDQSNPYDSMAELLILLGRYPEAETALAKALQIKSDFCHAYELKARLGLFSGRFELVEEAIRGLAAQPACAAMADGGYACARRVEVRFLEGDAESAWRLAESECPDTPGFEYFKYRAAVQTGRLAEALAMEDVLREREAEAAAADRPMVARLHQALHAHLEGIRFLAAGDATHAIERLSRADELASYWGNDERASFKLINRIDLLRALEDGGEKARADALRHKIAAVNPRILQEFRLPRLAG